MTTRYRYHLPPWSIAAGVVRRRCSAALAEVTRLPVASETTDGRTLYVRARAERPRPSRYKTNTPRTLTLELDRPADASRGVLAYRADITIPGGAGAVNQWLAALGREYVADAAEVGRGHWGDAHLVMEDRGEGRLLVEVEVPDDATWVTPTEWTGAIDVTDDPAWSRPVLSARAWPLVLPPSTSALGEGRAAWVKPAAVHPDLAEPDAATLDAALET